jgi:hypothetical protein
MKTPEEAQAFLYEMRKKQKEQEKNKKTKYQPIEFNVGWNVEHKNSAFFKPDGPTTKEIESNYHCLTDSTFGG